jgi:hypothetical protein
MEIDAFNYAMTVYFFSIHKIMLKHPELKKELDEEISNTHNLFKKLFKDDTKIGIKTIKEITNTKKRR